VRTDGAAERRSAARSLQAWLVRVWTDGGEVTTRERMLLAAAIVLGLAIQLIYVVATRHYKLAGDQPEYDAEAQLIAHGHWFYTRLPYGILHAGAWKAPAYPAWLALWYALVGHHPIVVRLIQVPVGALTIPLTWLLARRLFGARVALVAAFVVAVYPLAWQYDGLLYPEALATPLYVLLLIVTLTGTPTRRRAIGFGLLVGVALLLRPTTEFIFLGALVGWSLMVGWRRGLGLTVVAVLAAVVVVAPWTIRNAIVLHGFVPISLQDAALYGTFNSISAHDPVSPYAWRDDPAPDAYLFNPAHPLSDVTLRSRLIHNGVSYIEAHPASLFAAFFWNGLSRLWDVRHQSLALAEVPFEGRSRFVTKVGLDMYYVLLVLALVGLWRARHRRWFVFAVLALALGASIVFTVDSGTRYRAPLEPLIVVLACIGAIGPQLRVEPTTRPGLPSTIE
jgi:4-amino-4-deoxy-L-arabinose transferase-like glycosyltransferase